MDLSPHQTSPQRNAKPLPPPPASLTSDFKSAALTITKLYQHSARQIDIARQEGYLSAVEEVAAIISSGELASDRLHEWCAIGLSRISPQRNEQNSLRPRGEGHTENEMVEEMIRREQEPMSSPVQLGEMQAPRRQHFEAGFTFQEPLSAINPGGSSVPLQRRSEQEVTFEVIDNAQEEGGRKRALGVNVGLMWGRGEG